MTAQLTMTALTHVPEVQDGDALDDLLVDAMEAQGLVPQPGDVFVLAQKIVSKSEGRSVRLSSVVPSEAARELAREIGKDERMVELVLRESYMVVRKRPGILVVEDLRGFVTANAGIDASNVPLADGEETALLLPQDPQASAERLQGILSKRFGFPVGVVINDSWGRAWRVGTVGVAIGVSGIPAVVDMRGRPDMNGRTLISTEIAVADELAAAASLLMGQADEGRPAVIVRGFPYALGPGSARDLIRSREIDMFR